MHLRLSCGMNYNLKCKVISLSCVVGLALSIGKVIRQNVFYTILKELSIAGKPNFVLS